MSIFFWAQVCFDSGGGSALKRRAHAPEIARTREIPESSRTTRFTPRIQGSCKLGSLYVWVDNHMHIGKFVKGVL